MTNVPPFFSPGHTTTLQSLSFQAPVLTLTRQNLRFLFDTVITSCFALKDSPQDLGEKRLGQMRQKIPSNVYHVTWQLGQGLP